MKKYFHILSAFAAIVSASACNLSELQSDPSSLQEVKFSLSLTTRASETITSECFTEGDNISITAQFNKKKESSVYTTLSDCVSLTSQNPLYWPADEDEADFYAYYPSDCDIEDGTAHFVFPTSYSYFYSLNEADFLYACARGRKSDTYIPLNFKHLNSILLVEFDYKGDLPEAVYFDGLKYNMDVNLSDGSHTVSGPSSRIDCYLDYNDSKHSHATWLTLVAPQTLTGDIVFSMPDGNSYTFKIVDPVDLQAGLFYQIALDFDDPTVDGQRIEVVGRIEDWSSGGVLTAVSTDKKAIDMTVRQACLSPEGTRCRLKGWIGGELDKSKLSGFVCDDSGSIYFPELPATVTGISVSKYFDTGAQVTLAGTVSYGKDGHPQLIDIYIEKLVSHEDYVPVYYPSIYQFINSTPSEKLEYWLEGSVAGIQDIYKGYFYIGDQSAKVLVRGCNNCSTYNYPLIEGAVIRLRGFRSEFNGEPAITNCTIMGCDYPIEDVASISELLKKAPDMRFYRIRGRVSSIENTTYGNFYIEDETGSLYIYGVRNWEEYKPFFTKGAYVTISGSLQSYRDEYELVNVTVEKMEKPRFEL